MSRYGNSDYEDLNYELEKFLKEYSVSELLKLVTDAVGDYEWEHRKEQDGE